MGSISQYKSSIAADRSKQVKLENRLSTLQNKLANDQSIYQNALSQYKYSDGGDVYDSIAAENYYVDSKKYGSKIKGLKQDIGEVNHQMVVNTGNLSQLNSELQLAEQREQQEEQSDEESDSHWWSIFITIISMLPMLFM